MKHLNLTGTGQGCGEPGQGPPEVKGSSSGVVLYFGFPHLLQTWTSSLGLDPCAQGLPLPATLAQWDPELRT